MPTTSSVDRTELDVVTRLSLFVVLAHRDFVRRAAGALTVETAGMPGPSVGAPKMLTFFGVVPGSHRRAREHERHGRGRRRRVRATRPGRFLGERRGSEERPGRALRNEPGVDTERVDGVVGLDVEAVREAGEDERHREDDARCRSIAMRNRRRRHCRSRNAAISTPAAPPPNRPDRCSARRYSRRPRLPSRFPADSVSSATSPAAFLSVTLPYEVAAGSRRGACRSSWPVSSRRTCRHRCSCSTAKACSSSSTMRPSC